MNRLLVAFATASICASASAADKTVPVTVTNPVLPVEVSNADPIPVTVAPSEAGLVSCSRIYVGGIGTQSGIVRVDTGSIGATFDVTAPVAPFTCSEPLPNGIVVDEITVQFEHTQNATFVRAFLTMGDVGDSTPLVLGVVSRESPRVLLPHPVRITGPKVINFRFDCGTPLVEAVTCGAGFTLLGSKL